MSDARPLPRASDHDLGRWREAAIALADEADAIALAGFRRDVPVDRKPDRTFVTEVDLSIERLVRDRVRTTFPGCGLVGEEYGTDDASAAVTWYVDPIDATANFIRGIPVFATLLAVALDGELQLGLVSAPAMGERWIAWRGGGAWRGADRIRVSAIASIPEAQVTYGSHDDPASPELPGLSRTLDEAWRTRNFGDFWGYMLVAEGSAEAMVEAGAHPWDYAAPFVIVEEAGGRFTTARGERRIDGPTAVATNGAIHDALLAKLTSRG